MNRIPSPSATPALLALVGLFLFSGCDENVGSGLLEAIPQSLDFGEVRVGETALTPLTLQNGGFQDVNVEAPVSTGDAADAFSVADQGWPYSLTQGDIVVLQVSFAPTATGAQESTVTIAYGGAVSLEVPVSGIGLVAEGTDADGDGYPDVEGGGDDCNDQDPLVNPGATELCDDAIDNDCDGTIDVGEDADSDGSDACIDCDDTSNTIYPGADELCDGLDNDCDQTVDEEVVISDWYTDQDGDGYGDSDSEPVSSCDEVPGSAPNGDDCDDQDEDIHPNAIEYCDYKDSNCNGEIVDHYLDDDGDGRPNCVDDDTGDDDDSAGDDDDSAGR